MDQSLGLTVYAGLGDGEFQHVSGLIGKIWFLDRFVGYSTIIQPFSTGLQNTDNDLSDYFPNSSKVGT